MSAPSEEPAWSESCDLDHYREYVSSQTDSLIRGLTHVMFGDFSAVVHPHVPDPQFGNLAMMINVAINSARNALAEKEDLLGELRGQRLEILDKQAKLTAILEATDAGILHLATGGSVTYANGAFVSLTGLRTESFLGMQAPELAAQLGALDPSQADSFAQLLSEQALRGRAPGLMRCTIGKLPRVLRVNTRPVEGREGYETHGMLLILRDITEVEEARRQRDQMLGNLAHEIRTPLTTIKGFVDLVVRERMGPLAPEQHAALTRVSNSASRLIDLVGNMLDVDRLRVGMVQRSETELVPVLEEAIAIEASRANLKALQLESAFPFAPKVLCDRASLLQVARNLLSNAIKYTNSGFVRIQTHPSSEGYACFEIQDSGIGIPKELQRSIFHRFYRVENENVYAVGGTGVGLSIVKSFVDAVDGRVDVLSRPGAGSSFLIRIPEPPTS